MTGNFVADSLADAALACGARRAAGLAGAALALDASFRDACAQNACGTYGRCWMCPPDVGGIHELMARVREYPHAVLYQTVAALADSFDWEGMQEAGAEHLRVSRRLDARLRDMLPGGFLHLTRGGCGGCETCAKIDGLPCRSPDAALASMEGCGIDVCRTARAAGMPYINGPNTVTYFGIVLYGK
ncbi:MAG TPA: DUF2284 domain-containing protein [Candidatus Limnocylindria bacterium]|nr:DUF2284 domain-containing protein [Candidatus Limnocylindria bacterium]